MENIDFFDIAQPIDRSAFLGITHEVLQSSLFILAPFGLPRQLFKTVGSEALFVRKYGPRFKFILEAVSEVVYAKRGVSESQMAVTLYRYTEQEQDPDAIAYLNQMSDALRLVYSPPRVLELPKVLPESDLVSIGVSILRAGAIYTPGPRQASGDFSSEDSRSSTREGLPADRPAAMCEEGALSLCFTCQAQHASVGYRQHLRANMAEDNCHGESAADTTGAVTTANDADSGGIATPPGRSNVGTLDHGKAQRSKVASCLLAMDTARKKQESFSEDLEQTHFQAMTEAFMAEHSNELVNFGGTCTCSTSSDSPQTEEKLNRSIGEALNIISSVPFMDNEMFTLIKALEHSIGQVDAKEAGKAKKMKSIQLPDGRICEDPEIWLESVFTSQAYRMLGEQSADKGQAEKADKHFEEAYSEGSGYLPARYLAEILAGRAKCSFQKRDFKAASVQVDAALEMHATCGDAFLVRGQCRQEHGDYKGALSDLVNAFVLQGSALIGAGDGKEAQTIEYVSREACKEKAREKFSLREASNSLPASWVVRSFIASYDTEVLYAEQEKRVYKRSLGDREQRLGEAAFWHGIGLVREGRFAESIPSFSAALEAEDPRIQSLALEYYGCFQYLMGDMDASLESLRRSAEADTTNTKCWVKKGSILSDLGRREEAFECFDAAEAIDRLDSDLFLHRGQGHLLANNFRKATTDLKRSVELCSAMPISWAAWGVALFKLSTTDAQPSPSSVAKCLQVMEDALGRFPDNLEVLLFFAEEVLHVRAAVDNLARSRPAEIADIGQLEVLVSMGDFARGLELLKRSASLDPDCPLPYVNAARAYLGMNDLVAARRHLERGQEIDPAYPGTFMDMGQLLMQEGSPAEALSMYARGVDKARFPSEVHDALASLEVAKCHLEAQKLSLRDTRL